MRRRPIRKRCRSIFHDSPRRVRRLSGISRRFRQLSRSYGQVAYVLLTRPPLTLSRRTRSARLACIRHAASVRPEPGSNSPLRVVQLRSLQASLKHLFVGLTPAKRICCAHVQFSRSKLVLLSVACPSRSRGRKTNVTYFASRLQLLFFSNCFSFFKETVG